MASLLSSDERLGLAADLAQWSIVPNRDAITRSYQFKDFKEAFAFMTQCALMAEQMNHHPEWFNVWNRVEVTLSTHDAGGLTQLDLDLARSMDRYANVLLAK